MSCSISYLPYCETHAFSHLVIDYLAQQHTIKPFYQFSTDIEGIKTTMEARKHFPIDREKLIKALNKQYAGIDTPEAVTNNIKLLQQPDTFTVCTAHQPNLLTGYLYFIYKIVHAIKLAEELKKQFPENNFVPVYYMGSEDNDLEELGAFRYNNKRFIWNGGGQTGAVGRMQTESLKPLLDELFKILGPPGAFCDELKHFISEAYLQHDTIGKATQFLVNTLFGKYGLVVLDPDDALLKQSFIEIMKDDLQHQTANSVVSKQISLLSEHYKVQAHPRLINLFYLKDNMRERIEKMNGKWSVVHTDIEWTEEKLLQELNEYPERFSPNVILRGLFQETILPNIVFIGGGAEVAYWLQLKTLFEHYNIFYPSIHLRQSVLWVHGKEKKLREQLGLSINDMFAPETDLVHKFILHNSKDNWQTEEEIKILEQVFVQLKQKVTALDPTLRASAEAALAKMRYQLQVLEKKMLRAEKRKMQDQLLKIGKLKAHLFPAGELQERVENFLSFYLQHGAAYLDILKENMKPLRHEFMIIEEA